MKNYNKINNKHSCYFYLLHSKEIKPSALFPEDINLLYIEITNFCPKGSIGLSCDGCFIDFTKEYEISLPLIEKIIRQYIALNQHRKRLIVGGGEFIYHSDIISVLKMMLSYYDEKLTYVLLTSLMIDSNKLQQIINITPEKIFRWAITYDLQGRQKKADDVIYKNLSILYKSKTFISFDIIITSSELDFRSIEMFKKIVKESHPRIIHFKPFISDAGVPIKYTIYQKRIAEIQKALKSYIPRDTFISLFTKDGDKTFPNSIPFIGHCKPGFTISYNGNVYSCPFIRKGVLGNIKNDSLKQLSEKYLTNNIGIYKFCNDCEFNKQCFGFCRLSNTHKSNVLDLGDI